jgi:hypothetical protein
VFGCFYQLLYTIAEVAKIKMVGLYDQTGERVLFRQGLRLGWSKSVWRIILIILILILVMTIIMVVPIIVLVSIFIPLLSSGNDPSAFLCFTPIIILIVMMLLIGVSFISGLFMIAVLPLIVCSCIFEDLGVIKAIERGVSLCRRHLKDVGIMALLNYTIIMGWGLLLALLRLFLSLLGLLAGGGTFWLIGKLTGLFGVNAPPDAMNFPLLLGVLIYFSIMIIPETLGYAVLYIFQSSLWTLVYRQIITAETPQPESVDQEIGQSGTQVISQSGNQVIRHQVNGRLGKPPYLFSTSGN